jgi:glycosyltransferase involved in cell wall biosynthesis
MKKTLIAVEARIPNPETAGGIGQVIMSMAKNLSQLDDGPEEYVFIGLENATDWLGKYIGGPCRLHVVAGPGSKSRITRSTIGPAIEKVRAWRYFLSASLESGSVVPVNHLLWKSDGTVESLGADLVHFAMQGGYLTNCPSIYHPHDLQHFHMPEYFDANTLRWRLVAYRTFCQRARFVCVETAWIKEDVVKKLDIPADNVAVIPVAPPALPPVSMTSEAAVAAARMAGFPRFIFYPAQTWRHKNHLRLLEALQFLNQRWGLVVPLVCSGHRNEFFPEIQAKVNACGLAEQVRFLGFVGDAELSALYRLATALVVPTKFESLSLPIWEAFSAGVPVACSRVTSLPEQVDGAGLLFDPDDTLEIASAVKRLWEDEALRADLMQKGFERVKSVSGDRMARQFRTLYRKALGQRIDPEDSLAPILQRCGDAFTA